MANPSDQLNEAAGPSRTGARFNVSVSVLSMLAIVLMLNYLAMRHSRLISLSVDRYQPLSSVTVQVLKTVTNDVDIILYFDPETPLFSHVETLLRQYRDANPHLNLETVDYVRHPARAEEVKTRFNLGPNMTDSVLFVRAEHFKIVRQSELSEYNTDDLVSGRTKTVKRKAFRGESHFTSALLAVTHTQRPEVRYLAGFGDYHSPTNFGSQLGYSSFSRLLYEHNARIGPVDISGTNTIPAECQLLVLPGLVDQVPEAAQAKLDRFLENGGRMLVLFKYDSATGLERLLYRWGVDVQRKLVVDSGQSGDKSLIIVDPSNFGSHPVVQPLRQANRALALMAPRPVRSTTLNQAADAPQVIELLHTSTQGVAITDYRNGLNVNSQTDYRGKIPLAVSVEKGGILGVSEGSTRLVVIGDSHCFANQNLPHYGNRDFAWNIVSWLLDQSELLGIAPQPVKEFHFTLTDNQMTALQWIFLAGIPGGILILGWIVWARRQI
jgi:hypothetical protein